MSTHSSPHPSHSPERREYALRDGQLSALHFGDVETPVQLVFLHANGFNAQSYAQVLGQLGVHAVALDMRGHGQSRDMPQPNIAGYKIFRDDCVAFFDRHLPDLTDGPVVLAGHSFGSVTGILSAPLLGDRIRAYVGFDPVSLPLAFRLTAVLPGGRAYMKKRLPIARNAGRRKSEFESPEAAFARWQGRGAFTGMPDAILRDYIAGGLVSRADGTWTLACDPKWEQQIFVAQWHNLFKAARGLPDNSTVIYAGGRAPVSTKITRAAIAKAQPKADIRFEPALGHLFPLAQPELAIAELKRALE